MKGVFIFYLFEFIQLLSKFWRCGAGKEGEGVGGSVRGAVWGGCDFSPKNCMLEV